MKIAFIHYHLKTGGVSTVLSQQVEAIRNSCQVLVLTGEAAASPFPADTICIPDLGYDGPTDINISPRQVAESVIKAISSKWKTGCDLLHVHNPTLGKNKIFSQILNAVKASGIKLFLQIHDFAEDGRPLLYSSDQYVADAHYGVINSRDYQILLKAGLKKKRLHLIPNTVDPLSCNREYTKDNPRQQVLYPVRAIRRKNIGEAILLSLFFQNRELLSISLPPTTAPDVRSYLGWKRFAEKKGLNVAFDAGLQTEFEAQILSSKWVLTTSVSEGFGFSFLEPWAAGKILWGRKLCEICRDFEQNNVQLGHLYTELRVPLEWIGRERIFEKRKSSILRIGKTFDFSIDENCIDRSFAIITDDDCIDFGLLDEASQKKVIFHLLSSTKDLKQLIDINPYLLNPGTVPDKEKLIQSNRKAVLNNYSKTKYRNRLMQIYSRALIDSPRQKIDKKILISEFLNFDKFSLLKWADYAE